MLRISGDIAAKRVTMSIKGKERVQRYLSLGRVIPVDIVSGSNDMCCALNEQQTRICTRKRIMYVKYMSLLISMM